MGEDLKSFKEYYALSAKIIADMRKDELAECARLMAVQLAHYQQQYGNLPDCEFLSLPEAAELNEEQTRLLRDGMQILTGYLGAILDGPEENMRMH
jgi:hypothetical protein